MTAAAEYYLGLTSEHCTLNVLRDERGKYVHFNGLPPLYFDLAADPWETRPVENPAAVSDYRGRLLSRRMTHAERVLSDTLLTRDGPVASRRPRY